MRLFFQKNILFLYLFLSYSSLVSAYNEEYIELPSRDNIKQPFLLIDTPNAVATVVLFAGGKGVLGLRPDGSLKREGNFLVRSRQLFAQQGVKVVVFEVPSHKANKKGLLDGYRNSQDHAQDVEVIADYLQNKYHLPIWLIGTSRGSSSAANGAARLGSKIAGVVLTSSVSVGNDKGTQIFEFDLEAIRIPAYIASHENDTCHVTPPEDVKHIAAALVNSPNVKTKLFSGGGQASGRVCGGSSEHGFIGIEEQVVQSIVDFIKQASAGK